MRRWVVFPLRHWGSSGVDRAASHIHRMDLQYLDLMTGLCMLWSRGVKWSGYVLLEDALWSTDHGVGISVRRWLKKFRQERLMVSIQTAMVSITMSCHDNHWVTDGVKAPATILMLPKWCYNSFLSIIFSSIVWSSIWNIVTSIF